MLVAHTRIIIGIVGLMDSFLEEQVSQHCTSLRSVGVVAAVASSKSEVCNPVYIITGDGDEEITIVSTHYKSNSLFKPPRCFYTRLQVLDAMHILSMHLNPVQMQFSYFQIPV